MAHKFYICRKKNAMINSDRGQSLINKYVWVIDTIYSEGALSFKDLNKKWLETDFSRGVEIPRRTFENWKDAIADMFGIDIANENCGKYRYYIENRDDISGNELKSWIYKTFSIGNTLSNCQSIKKRIVLESVPSGRKHLQTIVDAMKENRVINITYKSYTKDKADSFNVQPYCIKLFRQRWYMVARGTTPKYFKMGPLIYSLDRIAEIHTTDTTFEMPEEWSASDYFDGCFGIIVGHDCDILNIKLKATAQQADYIRDLPLHESQVELERNDDYSIFGYRLRATYDFIQEILHNRENVEVLEPKSLRKQIKAVISEMKEKYK